MSVRGDKGSHYYRQRQRRLRDRQRRVIIGAAGAVLVVSLSIFGISRIVQAGKRDKGSAAVASTESNEKLKGSCKINDVDISGMTKEAARKAVLEKYKWNLRVSENAAAETETESGAADGSTADNTTAAEKETSSGAKTSTAKDSADDADYAVADLLKGKLEKVLTEIYDEGDKKEDHSYVLDAESMDAEIASEVQNIAKKWNRSAKSSELKSFDKTTNTFTYSDSTDGRKVDETAMADAIKAAMNNQNYEAVLPLKAETTAPELSTAEAKDKYKVIATFTTTATDNADRNNNLKLACEALDGKILKVGDEFSFNQTTGNRTLERGYKPAGAYQMGKVVLEPGGGVCQVSTTLYNTVVKAGIMPTERHAHTFAPTYVTPGEDAAVSYDGYAGPDMKFINTTKYAMAIRAKFDPKAKTVTVSLVGIPILDDGVTISMVSKKLEEMDNGGVEYVEDTTLKPGVEKKIADGTIGSRWVTNIVTKKNGEVTSDEFFHNSSYKGHSKKIARNTSGKVTATQAANAMTITENTETAAGQATASPTEAVNPGKAAESAASKVEPKNSETKATETSKSAETKAPAAETTKGPGANISEGPTMAPSTEETVQAAPQN